MPKKAKERKSRSCRNGEEYVKAAAWAWYQHGAGAPTNLITESDVRNRQKPASNTSRPSRFKLEAARLANLDTPSQPLNRVSKIPTSVDGFDKSIGGWFHMLEFHEEEDVGDSALLDHYEIVELTRSLEKRLSISVSKSALHSEDSWIERGLSGGLLHSPTVDVGDNCHKKKSCKREGFKQWCRPAMCSMTDVVIPGTVKIGSPNTSPGFRHHRSPSKKHGGWKLSERFHGVRQRLQQALVVSPSRSPSHGNSNIRASSDRRNSCDFSYKRQTCDRGLS